MSALVGGDYALSRWEMLKAQWRVIHALMLHDIKTRFFGNETGFLLYVAWPLSHILILILMFSYAGRAAPYGDSAAVWFATGVIPYQAFAYMSRFISFVLVFNKSLLSFPVIKVADMLLARAIVEVLTAGLVILIVSIVFWVCGINFMPQDLVQAGFALLSMLLLGLGFGVINASISGVFPFWINVYALSQIILWFASGVVIVPDALPNSIRIPLSYVPPLQGVEWMRSAYYDGFGASVLNKPYLLSMGFGTLFVGLALERLLRAKMLQ